MGLTSLNLKSDAHKNTLFEARALLAQYNHVFEFFASLQDPRCDFLLRTYEVFDSALHGPGRPG